MKAHPRKLAVRDKTNRREMMRTMTNPVIKNIFTAANRLKNKVCGALIFRLLLPLAIAHKSQGRLNATSLHQATAAARERPRH